PSARSSCIGHQAETGPLLPLATDRDRAYSVEELAFSSQVPQMREGEGVLVARRDRIYALVRLCLSDVFSGACWSRFGSPPSQPFRHTS
ncbi:MAG TPA: hypothetical protein VIW48_00120, partial [Nitrospiraceae bacterium]